MNRRMFCLATTLGPIAFRWEEWVAAQEKDTQEQGYVVMAGDAKVVVRTSNRNDPVAFVVAKHTVITKDMRPATIDKLHPQDYVWVMAQRKNDELIASQIDAQSPY